jgi:hypothetical protein
MPKDWPNQLGRSWIPNDCVSTEIVRSETRFEHTKFSKKFATWNAPIAFDEIVPGSRGLPPAACIVVAGRFVPVIMTGAA